MSTGAASCSTLVRVWVRIGLGDRRLAESLLRAVRPDDETAPPHLRVSERIENGDLVVEVEACADAEKRIGSVRNTILEVIDFTYAALKAIEAAQR